MECLLVVSHWLELQDLLVELALTEAARLLPELAGAVEEEGIFVPAEGGRDDCPDALATEWWTDDEDIAVAPIDQEVVRLWISTEDNTMLTGKHSVFFFGCLAG